MNFVPDRLTIYGKNNEMLTFNKVDLVELDVRGSEAILNMQASVDSKKEIFSITIPDEINKDKEYSLIKCGHTDAFGNVSNFEFYIRFPMDIIKLRIGDTFCKILSKNDCYCKNPRDFYICKEIISITEKEVNQRPLEEFKYVRIISAKHLKEVTFKDNKYVVETISGLRRVYDSFYAFNNAFENISLNEFIDLNCNIRLNEIDDIDFSIIDKFYSNVNITQCCGEIKEDKIMMNPFNSIFKNMTFGQIKTDDIKYSFNGIAFKNEAGEYAYLNDDFTFINVGNMVIDMPVFVAPVSIENVDVGDIIRHNNEWVIIADTNNDGFISAIKPKTREVVNIIPEKSIFGFDFYSKVINIFENIKTSANKDTPFGNLLPFIMMNGDVDNKNTMLMYMMMNNGNFDINNPIFLSMLMNDKNDNDLMGLIMMMNGLAAQNKNNNTQDNDSKKIS